MRRERITRCWMHWEKYIELTFDSKSDLSCIKDKFHKCRCRCRCQCRCWCRDADAEFSKWPEIYYHYHLWIHRSKKNSLSMNTSYFWNSSYLWWYLSSTKVKTLRIFLKNKYKKFAVHFIQVKNSNSSFLFL